MNRSSHKKNKRYDSEDSDPQSQSNSSDSNQDDASSFMGEDKSDADSEIPVDEIRIRKFQDDATGAQITEFSIELPERMSTYENFVWSIEPLIEKIEEFFSSDGEANLSNPNRASDLERQNKFEPTNAIHFTGALIQSYLKFFQEDRKLTFRFEKPRLKGKPQKLHEQVLKPILAKFDKKIKNTSKCSQEFIMVCQDKFDPFSHFDETMVINQLSKIVQSYERILKDCERDHKSNFFDKLDNVDDILKLHKPKYNKKKKEKSRDLAAEDAAMCKIKAELLLKNMKNNDKSPQKNPGASNKPLAPKDLTEPFGGEIELSYCSKPEDVGRVPNQSEKELRELLIAEYNESTDESFLFKLLSILAEKAPLKISLYTAVLLSVVFNQRASKVEDVTLADLLSFINISNFIPFPATPALKSLNSGYLIAKCIDRLMSVEMANCTPKQTYSPSIKDFNHEIYCANVSAANLCLKFLELYASQIVKVTTPTSAKLALYDGQLALLNRIFDFVENQGDKTGKPRQKKQIEGLLDEIKNITGMKKFAECDYLASMHQKIQKGGSIDKKSEKKNEKRSEKKSDKKTELQKNLKKPSNLNITRQNELNAVAKNLKFSEDVKIIEEVPLRVISLEDIDDDTTKPSKNKPLPQSNKKIKGSDKRTKSQPVTLISKEKSSQSGFAKEEVPKEKVIQNEMPIEKPEPLIKRPEPQNLICNNKTPKKSVSKGSKQMDIEFDRTRETMQIGFDDNFYFNETFDFQPRKSSVYKNFISPSKFIGGLESEEEMKMNSEYKYFEDYIQSFEEPKFNDVFKQNDEVVAAGIANAAIEEEPDKDDLKIEEPVSKKDLKIRKIEKEFAKNMKVLLKKTPLDDARNQLGGLQNAGAKKKKEKLKEQIQKTEEWLELYNQKFITEMNSIDKIQDLIEKILETPLRTKEMDDLLEKQRLFEIWRVRFDSMLKKYKKRIRKNAAGQINLLTFEELEAILKDAIDLKIYDLSDEPRLEELRIKYKKIQSLIETFEASSNDLNVIRKVNKELLETNITYSYFAEALHERIELNERMILFLETVISVDALEEFTRSLSDKLHMLDPSLYTQLERKQEEAISLRNMLPNLTMSRESYDYEQICERSSVMSAIKSLKIEIPNQQVLNNVLLNFKWLLDLEKLIQNYARTIPKSLEMVAESSQTSTDAFGEEFQPDEVVKFCEASVLETFRTKFVDEQMLSQLKNLLQEAHSFSIVDRRIETLFQLLTQGVYGKKGSLLEDPQMIAESRNDDVIELENDDHMIIETDERPESPDHFKNWKTLYSKVESTNPEEFLRKQAETSLKDSTLRISLIDLRENLNTLLNSYEEIVHNQENLEEKITFLQKLQAWTDWLVTADEWNKRIDDKREEISFNDLKDFYLIAKEIGAPKSWMLFKKMEEKFMLADSLLAEVRQKFQVNSIKPDDHRPRSPLKGSIRKQLEANKQKPTVAEAKKLRTALKKKLSFLNCTQELASLDNLLEEQAKWRSKMEAYSKNHGLRVLKAAVDTSDTLEDCLLVETELNQLKAAYFSLSLRDEQDDKALTGLAYQLRSYLLLKTESGHSNVEDWKNILRYAEENPKVVDPTDDNALLSRLKAELEVGKEHHEFVRMLRSLNQKTPESLTLPELKFFLSELRKCPIRIPEDESFVLELVEKMEKLSAQSRQLCDISKKDSVIDFTNLLDQIKRASISLPEEEKLLEDALNCADRIARSMTKHSNIDMQLTEKLLNEYKACPVYITEAEKLLERYEKSRGLYESLKAKLNACEVAKTVDYEQLEEIQDGLAAIRFDFDGGLTRMKAQLYSLRIKHLQRLASNQERLPNYEKYLEKDMNFNEQVAQRTQPLNPQVVKELSHEGNMLKKALIEQQKETAIINQALFWVDNLSRRINDKIKEINAVSSREALDRLPKQLLGFVDLTEILNEKRATLPAIVPVDKPQKLNTEEVSNSSFKAQENKDSLIQSKERQLEEGKNMPIKNALDTEKKQKEAPTTIQKANEKNEKQLLENLQPGKLVLKIRDKLKENSNKSQSKKDKSLMEESSPSIQSKEKLRLGANDFSLDKAITDPIKIDTKKSKAVQTISEILQSNNTDLSSDSTKCIGIAHSIIIAFPILDQSKDKLTRFATFLKDVSNYPNIYQNLSKKSFPSKLISKLFSKSPCELSKFEKKLTEAKESKGEGKCNTLDDQNEANETDTVNKKVKVQDDAKAVNMFEKPDIQSIEQQTTTSEVIQGIPTKDFSATDLIRDEVNLDPVSQPNEKAELISSMDLEANLNQVPLLMMQISQQVEEEVGFQLAEEQKQEIALPDLSRYYFSQKRHQTNDIEFENYPNEQTNSNSQSRLLTEISRPPNKFSQALTINHMEEEPKKFKPDESAVPTDKENDYANVPQDAILKIFDGMLKAIGDESAPRIGLYTISPIQAVRTFPRIESEGNNSLLIGGKMVYSKFEPYINKSATDLSEERVDFLAGWVESPNSVHQDACERISKNFLQSNKIGVTKYGECAKIFFMHESQFNQKWVERFNFQKKKIQKSSHSSLCFILMFHPAKFASDLSLLKRIEPEVVAPYIEKSEDDTQNSKGILDASKSGSSTPEIEPYSQSISQNQLDIILTRLLESKETDQSKQPELEFTMIGEKPAELKESHMIAEDSESKGLSVKPLEHKMEIEKDQAQAVVEVVEISKDTERLLNQPLSNVIHDDDEPVIIPLDPRIRRGLKGLPKPEESNKPTFKTEMDNGLSVEDLEKPQKIKLTSKISPPKESQMEEEEAKTAPKDQLENQVKPEDNRNSFITIQNQEEGNTNLWKSFQNQNAGTLKLEEPQKKFSESMLSPKIFCVTNENKQEIKNSITLPQHNKIIPYDPEDDTNLMPNSVTMKPEKRFNIPVANSRVPLILNAPQNKPTKVIAALETTKNITEQNNDNHEENQRRVVHRETLDMHNSQAPKKMFSSNQFSYEFSSSEDCLPSNNSTNAVTKSVNQFESKVSNGNASRILQAEKLSFSEQNQPSSEPLTNTVKMQTQMLSNQSNGNVKTNLTSYQYTYTEENQSKTNNTPKTIPKVLNQFGSNQLSGTIKQNLNLNQNIIFEAKQPLKTLPDNTTNSQSRIKSHQNSEKTNNALNSNNILTSEEPQKSTGLINDQVKGQIQVVINQGNGNTKINDSKSYQYTYSEASQQLIKPANNMLKNPNEVAKIQNNGATKQILNSNQYTNSEDSQPALKNPSNEVKRNQNQSTNHQDNGMTAKIISSKQLAPSKVNQSPNNTLNNPPKSQVQVENSVNTNGTGPKKIQFNQPTYSEKSQPVTISPKNLTKPQDQIGINQNNGTLKQDSSLNQLKPSIENQTSNKPSVNQIKNQNQPWLNQANSNENKPLQNQWKPQSNIDYSVTQVSNYSQRQEPKYEDQNYEDQNYEDQNYNDQNYDQDDYAIDNSMQEEQELPNNQQFNQYNQYNQPKFGGNYQRGNQNFKPQTNGQYNNRNGGYQKPYYDNRSGFNDNYNNQNGSNFQGNRYNSNQRNGQFNSFNNQNNSNFSNQNQRFNSQQSTNRAPQFSDRTQQNFNNQRQYSNSYRQNNYQDSQNYANQQGNVNSNASYDQQGSFPNQSFQNFLNTKGSGMLINNRTFNGGNYSTSNNIQPKPQPNTGVKTNTSTNANGITNVQQEIAPKKAFAENSIFGKARINLLNAFGGNIANNKNQPTTDQ